MPTIKPKKSSLVFPSDIPMSNDALAAVILDAEKGPFYTSQEVKQALKKWSKKYSQ